MMQCVHYDSETINHIRSSDMVEFLGKYRGFTFRFKGRQFRCCQHDSLVIKENKLTWYWNSKGAGGFGIIDYLMKIEGFGFQEAVATANNTIKFFVSYIKPTEHYNMDKIWNAQSEHLACEYLGSKKTFSLPEKGGITQATLYHYLHKIRGIDENIISELSQEEKIYQDKKGNVVFVGYDENKTPRYASLRGTNLHTQFRMDCQGSDKKYSFLMNGTSLNRVFVFESPIDAMSHATLENIVMKNPNAWKNDNRLSLGGTSDVALKSYLERNTGINTIIACLDNDEAGKTATEKILDKYSRQGYTVSYELPIGVGCKDFNEVLVSYRKNELKRNSSRREIEI